MGFFVKLENIYVVDQDMITKENVDLFCDIFVNKRIVDRKRRDEGIYLRKRHKQTKKELKIFKYIKKFVVKYYLSMISSDNLEKEIKRRSV